MNGLTQRQEQLLRFIETYGEMHGFPPSIREMAEHMGIRSTNGVNDHLKALLRKGYVRRDGGSKSRALTLSRRRGSLPFREEQAIGLPILGRVAAGQPILAEENFEGRLPVGRSLLRGAGEAFALRVRGESMIGKGILDGDLVIVRSQNTADPGQVVVAMVEGEATVKIFRPERDCVRFEPANPAMQPIVIRREEFRQTDILGVVIGVFREVR